MGHNRNDMLSSTTEIGFVIQDGQEMVVQKQVCADTKIVLGLNVDKAWLFLVFLSIGTLAQAIGFALIVAKVTFDQGIDSGDIQVFVGLLCG